MPDTRLAKARATLPSGYQFGDAGKTSMVVIDVTEPTAFKFAILQPEFLVRVQS